MIHGEYNVLESIFLYNLNAKFKAGKRSKTFIRIKGPYSLTIEKPKSYCPDSHVPPQDQKAKGVFTQLFLEAELDTDSALFPC